MGSDKLIEAYITVIWTRRKTFTFPSDHVIVISIHDVAPAAAEEVRGHDARRLKNAPNLERICAKPNKLAPAAMTISSERYYYK